LWHQNFLKMPISPNFGATVLLPTLGRMSEMFNDDKSRYAQFLEETPVLKAVAENQTATFTETMLDSRTNCMKHRAWWIIPPAPVSVPIIRGCDIQKGNAANSDYKEYLTEKFETFVFHIKPEDCVNTVRHTEVLATGLMTAKSHLRGVINNDMIATLNANAATVNRYDGGTFSGNEKTYPSSDWKNLQKISRFLQKEKRFNHIFNSVLVNGENLEEQAYNAMFNGTNGCCTNEQKIINSLGKVYWDDMFLEQALSGQKASFLFDANRIAVLNSWDKDLNATPRLVNERNHIYAYTVQDDMLKINQNGQLVSATYEVKMQPDCDTDNSRNLNKMLIKYEVTACWSVVTAPGLNSQETGIIKLVNA
jgi:hypothetical protein